MILVLDKGHGGKDPGACGNGLEEANLTDDICNRIAAKLVPYDVQVEFAPRSSSLNERAAFANGLNADYFCSIHINAGGGTGFESYVHTGAGDDTERIRTILHSTIYSGFLAGQGVVDRGKKRANFAVLRETNMPAVLLENLFIDTATDAAKLKDSAFLDGLANEIAYGLVVALGLQKKTVVDTDKITIKVAGQILEGKEIDGRAWAPVRALAEALGKTVSWDEATRTVNVI
ncbi:MAG: Sporulation-specific N-acetylmuramoyl-L-alanine amidase [Pelotomaculum sp. PtaU1.Bin065]|nr:MAG: Sporulation-specific N-acetylmuramoyl-L-alanine amidase [Pelotomaculum sp. PtaU1.Bin065]